MFWNIINENKYKSYSNTTPPRDFWNHLLTFQRSRGYEVRGWISLRPTSNTTYKSWISSGSQENLTKEYICLRRQFNNLLRLKSYLLSPHGLKGQCHKIFCFRIFHESSSLKPLKITLGPFEIFFLFLEIFKSWCPKSINDPAVNLPPVSLTMIQWTKDFVKVLYSWCTGQYSWRRIRSFLATKSSTSMRIFVENQSTL